MYSIYYAEILNLIWHSILADMFEVRQTQMTQFLWHEQETAQKNGVSKGVFFSRQPNQPTNPEADLHQLFGMLDSDGGGTIDPEEFKQTLTSHLGHGPFGGGWCTKKKKLRVVPCRCGLGWQRVASCKGCRVCFGLWLRNLRILHHSATFDTQRYIYIYISYYISVLASVHWSFP